MALSAAQLFLLSLSAAVRFGFPQTIQLLGECVSLTGTRCVTNNCKFPVWPGVRIQQGNNTPEYTGFGLGPRYSKSFQFPATITNVKVWGRTACNVQEIPFNCDTGNCGPNVTCTQDAQLPVTLVNIYPKTIGTESYEVSLLEGFNVPMSVGPSGLTTIIKMLVSKCPLAGGCKYSLATMDYCPLDLLYKNPMGQVCGCQSPCERYDTDEACCRGEYASKDKCLKQNAMPSLIDPFRVACPRAKVTPFDDKSYSCLNLPVVGTAYTINFC